jgi:hypothetical protein
MSFDWMEVTAPARDGAAANKATHAQELRERAGLLHRLGYTKTAALARCKARIAWEFDGQGASPLSDREVKSIVSDVFAT